MNDWRPRFDRYYQGAWPHCSDDGVGLELSGVPADPREFLDLLQAFSCNPPAARRILADLQEGQAKRTTVMAQLDFNAIGDLLAAVGVTLRILEPAAPADQRIDQVVFDIVRGRRNDALPEFDGSQRELIAQRVAHMRDSLSQLPHDYGPYAR